MATMVLSAAGSAVGGPIGGAVGSFLGRQVDRNFGNGSRGRLTDLRAPSSQYGDLIPAVVRRMRVAGVVLWSATPVATATVSKSGTGQGSSVSFAYGLSSGRVERIGRVWADGRLIRDGEGRQEIPFDMRLHSGDEDQPSDPLIASILGEDRAPAFRGIAYVMFENFDLSSFGNRLPLITVELTAEGDRSNAEDIVRKGLELAGLSASEQHELEGYALAGDDQATALAPLFDAFAPAFAYDSKGWTMAPSATEHIIDPRLWALSGKGRGAVEPAPHEKPTKISIRYFDPTIDFAAGEKSARLPGQERLSRIELPAAMSGDQAKAAAFEQLARAGDVAAQSWLRLPLSFSHIRLGDKLSCEGMPGQRFVVAEKVLKAGEFRLRLRREAVSVNAIPTEAGGVSDAAMLEREPLTVALVELPGAMFDSEPEVAVLASGGHHPFQPLPVSISMSGSEQKVVTANVPTPPGKLLMSLPAAASGLLDRRSVLEVRFDQDPILLSCDEAALLAGANLLWVNGEFIQFATAEPLGGGSYMLSCLIRGLFDSETIVPHRTGSPVLLLDPAAITRLKTGHERIGSAISARVHGPDGMIAEAGITIAGLAARPWSPDHVNVNLGQDGLRISWTRRCNEGAPWLDHVDAPLGASTEKYSVSLFGALSGSLQLRTDVPSVSIDTPALVALGPRPWRLEVRQLGDFAASKPRIHVID